MKQILKRFSLVMALFFLLVGMGVSAQKKWPLRPSVETDHTVVSFGEILLNHHTHGAFSASVLEHPVFQVQKPGKTHYTREVLDRRLKVLFPGETDLPVRIPSDGIWIRRVFRIQQEKLFHAFREVIQKQFGAMGRIDIKEFKIKGNTEIPDSIYRIIPVAPAGFRKRMTVKFEVLGKGWKKILFARGEISIKGQVLVVKRTIRKGEPLGPKNTALVEEDITRLHRAFLLNRHDTIGIDLVAMVVNDIVSRGRNRCFSLITWPWGNSIPTGRPRLLPESPGAAKKPAARW